jgi:dTMP kinase
MLGKLIVFDGVDGSGKTTQLAKLSARLKADGRDVECLNYPNMDSFFGELIGKYLKGYFGTSESVSPHLISVVYACDRLLDKEKVKAWLKNGKVVLCKRYTTANMVHQGGKISDLSSKEDFMHWISELEFDVFDLSKPDLVICLDVSLEVEERLIEEKNNNKSKDIHENNHVHLFDAMNQCKLMHKYVENFVKIDCMNDGKLMSVQEIDDLVYKEVKQVLN